jgi:hypothetical protein
MAIRYDENGVPYDDGSFDYEALQQQAAPQEQPIIVQEQQQAVPQEQQQEAPQEQQQVEQQQVEEQAVQQYLQQEEEKQAEQILVQEEADQQAIDQQAMEEELVAPTSESILEPYKYEDPVSEAEKVSTSEFENARRTPLRPGGATPVRDFLFGRKGRYTESESPIYVSEPSPSIAVAEEQAPIQKLNPLAPTSPGEYDYTPLGTQGPPPELKGSFPGISAATADVSATPVDASTPTGLAALGDGVIKMPAGDANLNAPKIYSENINDLERILGYGFQQDRIAKGYLPSGKPIDNLGRDVERAGQPLYRTPEGRMIAPENTGQRMLDIFKYNPELGAKRESTGLSFNPNTRIQNALIEERDGLKTNEQLRNETFPLTSMDIIGNEALKNTKTLYPKGYVPEPLSQSLPQSLTYDQMVQRDRDGVLVTRPIDPNETPDQKAEREITTRLLGEDQYKADLIAQKNDLDDRFAMQGKGRTPQEVAATNARVAQYEKEAEQKAIANDPTSPSNTIQARVKAAMAAEKGMSNPAGAAPMPSTVPAASATPTAVTPMPSSDTVQSRMKEAMAAAGTPAAGTPAVKADEKPYQMTPVEQAAKIMADLKTSQRLGTPEQQAAAREAYQKGVASGIIKPLNFDAAGAIKSDPQTLVNEYYNTKNPAEKKLIAGQIAESLLVPLSESDKEALKAGENVKRKFNFLPAVGLKGEQELGNVDINSIAQRHLQTLQGGAYITKPEDVGIAPAQPNNQGPSGSSLIPTPDGGFKVPYVDPDGKFNQQTIPPRSGLVSVAQADRAIGLITQKMTEDANRIPLPNIKRILAGEAERTDTLNSGALDKLQNLTQAWSDSVRKDWSHSISNTRSGSSTNSVGSSREVGIVTSIGSNNSSAQGGSQSQSGKGYSNSSNFSNTQGSSVDQRNSVVNRNSQDSSNTQGSSTTETVTSGGGTTKTQTESKETIDNRNAVMGMLSNLDQQKVSNMMQDYKNKIDQVTNGNKEIRSEYIKQADILLANQGKEQANKELVPILTQNPIPDRNAMAALEPHNSNSIVKYIEYVSQSQPAVAKGWSQAVPDFYTATDGHSNRANNATPLIDIRFPVIQSILKGEMGIREGVKDIGPESRKMIEAFSNLIPAQDVASKAFERDGYEEGLRKLGNNASESNAIRNFNSMKVLNAYDTLTNMMIPKTAMPDGSISPRKLIPPEEFVKQVTDLIVNNPKGNSHMGAVAFEMMKTNKPYREYLQKYSDSRGLGFLWSNQAEIDKYNRLKALSDPVNHDAYIKNGGMKLQPRW